MTLVLRRRFRTETKHPNEVRGGKVLLTDRYTGDYRGLGVWSTDGAVISPDLQKAKTKRSKKSFRTQP